MRIVNFLTALIAVLALGACATEGRVRDSAEKMRIGPKGAPTKTITSFSSGLKCMDNLFLEYRMPERTFLIEGLNDQTGKVSSGTRDMLITALANMSRRSEAIRVIAYDFDSSNAISFMERATGRQIYSNVPTYDIRGSISQYDSRVASSRMSGALSTKEFGVGGDQRYSADIMGIDLSIVRTADLSVIPAVTSSNQVIITDANRSGDGDAFIKNSGVYFNFTIDRAEGVTQALRNLLDVAAIELMGRLTRVPYWQCLGIPEENEAVQQEVSDWIKIYERGNLLMQFVRRVLYVKGYYDTNNSDETHALQTAVRAYQQDMGIAQDGVVDQDFIMALYRRPPVLASTAPVAKADTAPSVKQPVQNAAPMLTLDYSNQLTLTVDRPAFVHCYFDDGNRSILRFYPNRFDADNLLEPADVLTLPGNMPFALEVEPEKGEAVRCFATDESIGARLPMSVQGGDFETLRVASLDDVRQDFIKTALAPVGEAHYGAHKQEH